MFSKKLIKPLNFVRFYKTNDVRVRFAPSPTGYLHLGGLRTALYNYLYAKSKNGKFILRIEDTDQNRLINGASEQLKNDLIWSCIEIDEGPNIGGDYGPYKQSERLNIYNENVKILIENRSAYYCFCTERRLDLLRREALKNREIPKYDNKCRHLTDKEVEKKINEGVTPCIRFKLSSDITSFNDLIYGNINYDISQQEGDPVIVKTDGYPTYHFANVVDDYLMKITHVFRGIEWQISATKHLLIYKAFGWKPPQYGHLPLLLNSDGTKLSKRQNDINIIHYKENGIFPLALINYVMNAGGGFEKDQIKNVKTKIHTIDELVNQFDINKINTNSGKLMKDKLEEFNNLELKRRLQDVNEEKKLIDELKIMLNERFSMGNSIQIDENHIRNVLNWSINRINNLNDLTSKDMSFIWVIPERYSLNDEDLMYLNDLIKELDEKNFNKDELNKFLREFSGKYQIKFVKLMKDLRSILSGLKEGPGVAEMMEILGKETTLFRIKMCLNNNTKF